MPGVVAGLSGLVSIPSIAFPGFPGDTVRCAADATAALLIQSGVSDVRILEIPDGYPAVYCEIPGPEGAPTVLLYAHYDVQPAPPDQGWTKDPWTPVVQGGRLYGRGAADDKCGIAVHAASIAAFSGKPPVSVKIVIEGEEEAMSHLEEYVAVNPELFQCDLFVIADMGNPQVGKPALSTTLRGEASCTVAVKTLARAVHSGTFGGPAPDALIALVRMLATLHDENGDIAVKGLVSSEWDGAEYPEEAFRKISGVLEGVDLIGTGTVASRAWSKPSVTVIGLDAPRVATASNVLIPEATARLSLRVAPGADPDRELSLLMDHLRKVAPWHVRVEIKKIKSASGFVCPTAGPGFRSALRALEGAWGIPAVEVGGGGSIPLVNTLSRAVPGAEFVLWGCGDDEVSHIHGPDESVDLGELERLVVAQCLLFEELAKPGPV